MRNILYKIFFFLFGLLYSFIAYPQNKIIDSLQKVLLTKKEDTNKVNTLNELSTHLSSGGDYKTASQKAKEALTLSEKLNFTNGKGGAFLSIGYIYESQGNYPEARNNYYSAIKYYRQTESKTNMANVFLFIVSTYNEEENSTKALNNIYEALKLYEEIGDKTGVAECYVMLGSNNSSQKNYAESLKYFFSALKTYEDIHSKAGIAVTNALLGETYKGLGNYDEALKRELLAIENYDTSDKLNTAGSLRIIGQIYTMQGSILESAGDKVSSKNKYNEAFDKYLSAIKLYEKEPVNSEWIIADTYAYMGKLFIKLKNKAKAKLYLEKSLKFFSKNKDNSSLENLYLGLAELDSVSGNFAKAYEHYKMYISYRDSSFNEETTKKLTQSKLQYEFDKKESIAKAAQDKKDAETKRIKNRQYSTIAALGIVVLAVLIIALIQFRNNKHKQKANLLLQEQKVKVESTLSELKSTQAQLIQSEKMASLGELTAGIAHEIQNPLNFVNNFSEVSKELLDEMKTELDNGNADDAKEIANDVIQNLEKINHHGKRADAIVKGMLQHSRTSTGQKELTDINALADEYLRLSYHGMRAKDKSFNSDFKTNFDNSIGKINIIPQDIGRVLLNLYNNAFYAVSEKKKIADNNYEPTVTVSTKKINNAIELTVTDNGNGIPQNIVDKIFQPFFTTKPTGEGTGLGLSLSYDIIKAHGGEIKVETKEGEGTTFIITLTI